MSDNTVTTPNTDEARVSYGLGWQFGRHLLTHDFDGLSLDDVIRGLKDCYQDNPSPISDEQVEVAFKTIAAREQNKREKAAAELAGKSEEFMAANADKDGVMVTESGLQYRIVEPGDGRKPGKLDEVTVHYHGVLLNGQVFDSSVERKEAATFAVQEVIPGWTELLQLMPLGAKFRAYVPPQLAYGEQGKPPIIPGNATLIFDIELLEITNL
jgi:FKBP-type peptidyl-prolyl cis-trans isomerase FklB